jgi:LmbE family N-acetylglucosaminyl deacetylase
MTTGSSTAYGSTTHPAPAGPLLGIWAHPDDEAYLSAALMARARREGRRVVVVSATRGEQGAQDPGAPPPHRLARARAREQKRSLRVLGVREQRWLGYRDGELADVEEDIASARITALINAIRPQTLVTFGPDGLTGHRDHRAVSRWVSRACHEASFRGQLWHATLTEDFHHRWGSLSSRLGVWMDQRVVPSTPAHALVHQVVCDETESRLKLAALRAHASQTRGLIAEVGEEVYRRWWSTESFVAGHA